jgi:hypothetical protein
MSSAQIASHNLNVHAAPAVSDHADIHRADVAEWVRQGRSLATQVQIIVEELLNFTGDLDVLRDDVAKVLGDGHALMDVLDQIAMDAEAAEYDLGAEVGDQIAKFLQTLSTLKLQG